MTEPVDHVAALDQALRAMVDFAKLIREYYSSLSAEGFPATEALTLTLGYQSSLMSRVGSE